MCDELLDSKAIVARYKYVSIKYRHLLFCLYSKATGHKEVTLGMRAVPANTLKFLHWSLTHAGRNLDEIALICICPCMNTLSTFIRWDFLHLDAGNQAPMMVIGELLSSTRGDIQLILK